MTATDCEPYYVIFIRPVGSSCWTPERLALTPNVAEELAIKERNRKLVYKDGSVHLQSTAIGVVYLPKAEEKSQQHYSPGQAGLVVRGIP